MLHSSVDHLHHHHITPKACGFRTEVRTDGFDARDPCDDNVSIAILTSHPRLLNEAIAGQTHNS